MSVRLLTEHHLEFLSLKGGCRDLRSTLVKNATLLEITCHGSYTIDHPDFIVCIFIENSVGLKMNKIYLMFHTEILHNMLSDNFAKRLHLLTELATKQPDLRDVYLFKSQIAAHKFEIISDESQIKTQLTDIEPLFKTIEEQLEKIKKGEYMYFKALQGGWWIS